MQNKKQCLGVAPPNIKKIGFTLIELLVVIAIMGIFSGVILITMSGATNFANDAKRKANLDSIKKALLMYGANNGAYPIDGAVTPCEIGNDASCTVLDPILKNGYFGTIPTDPIGTYYTYQSTDGTDFTIGATLSDNSIYSYTASTGTGTWVCGSTITDTRNSKTYNTVQIGTQCWMKENMDYDNGCSSVTWVNSSDEGWCGYYTGGPFTNEGLLYQWSAAMNDSVTEGAQGICPTGWHLPTDAEYVTLEQYTVQVIASPATQYACNNSVAGWQRCADDTGTYEGGPKGAGKSLKKVGQGSGVGAGDDLVGFSSYLPGYRDINGSFYDRTTGAYLWSSSPSSGSAWNHYLDSTCATVARYTDSKAYGISVRCLKN